MVNHSTSDLPPSIRDALSACWSCQGPVSVRTLFCDSCRSIQAPVTGLDPFTRLNLPLSFEVDRTVLDQHYFALQRHLHPDRFRNRTAHERVLSQSQAASLNEAYNILKDPLKRAESLLALKGQPLPEDGKTLNDPVLLMEQLERREALAEADDPTELARLTADAEAEVLATTCHIAQAFAADDLSTAGTQTLRLKYLTKLADDARRKRLNLR